MSPPEPATVAAPVATGNRYDRREWAGAFGDLGTLVPFVIAYVGIVKMDPFGVLFGFGVSMMVCGGYYKTPMPVQPMKAVGAVATAQAAQMAGMTQAAVHGAGLATGLIWLLLGLTGIAQRLTRWISRPVAQGVMLGLGLAFMWQGSKSMAQQWPLAGAGLLAVLLLSRSRRLPAIFALLLIGFGWTALRQPALFAPLADLRPQLRWPDWAWRGIGWNDLVLGTLLLALPQVPLTLGNAIIGVRAENNRLFPDRPLTDRQLAVSTGVLILLGAAVGGVPMCHGAGGMLGHVAFGARSGGSVVILGALLTLLALFLSSSVLTLFALIPPAILGTILFTAGLQLARGQFRQLRGGRALGVMLATAALSSWNIVLGMGTGLVLQSVFLRDRRRS